MTNLALSYLTIDPIMAELVDKLGLLEVKSSGIDPFTDLIDAIISQQLSVKAAKTIFGRFKALLNKYPFDPQEILDLDTELARKAGASFAKISYSKNIAQAVISGELSFHKLHTLTDEEIKSELIKIKGIGPWTAEMFLIFTLGRPDVFSEGDLGLKNALKKLYPQGVNPELWSPYRSYACLYLWKSLDNA